MNHQELTELLRYGSLCPVSGDGCEDKLKASDAIESLLAENERLKHNLQVTEQTMREYQELAAKRLEEIAKYRDAIESHGPEGRNYTNLQFVEMRQKFIERINEQKAELAKYRDAPVVAWSHLVKGLTFVETYAGSKPLIVKPGE